MAGHLNGSGSEPPKKTNITSLDEVRKRAEAEAKAAMRSKRAPSPVRDWIIGGIIVAMALGTLWHWLAPLFRSGGMGR